MSNIDSSFGSSAKRCRKSDRDVFHAYMVKGAKFEGAFDMPTLGHVKVEAKGLIAFPDAMSARVVDENKFVHFFVDDWRFERFWNNPHKYLEKLKQYAGVIEPDFSTCSNFPEALKIWNTYRNRSCSRWLQDNGVIVVPNLRVEPDNADYSLAGIPRRSTIAIGANGCVKNRANRRRFSCSLKYAVDKLLPSNIIVYGSDAYDVFEYPKSRGIPISFHTEGIRGNYGDDADERKVL